jgi:hypothetical protein
MLCACVFHDIQNVDVQHSATAISASSITNRFQFARSPPAHASTASCVEWPPQQLQVNLASMVQGQCHVRRLLWGQVLAGERAGTYTKHTHKKLRKQMRRQGSCHRARGGSNELACSLGNLPMSLLESEVWSSISRRIGASE